MVLDYAEDAFVVVTSAFGSEVYDYASGRVGFDSANCLAEAEHVGRISVELELGGKVGIVNHVQDSVSLSLNVYFTKV